ncbi:DUF3990 domain-containing protein [Eggerthellaceae bacterium zg-893]|nr:DUF3990 domain-containing protein [Eggerthellaceae bacterium zg-893]
MLAFHEGLVLYHGSYADVREIDLERCAPGKDFGRGFYLTTDYDQAKSFVALLPNRLSDQYCFRTEKAIGHLVFEGSDVCEG